MTAALAAGSLLLAGVALAGDHDRDRDYDRGYSSREQGRYHEPRHTYGEHRSPGYLPPPRGPIQAEARRQFHGPHAGYVESHRGWAPPVFAPPPPVFAPPPPVYVAPRYHYVEPRVVYSAPVYAPPVAYYSEPSYYDAPTRYSSYDNEPSYASGYIRSDDSYGYSPGYYTPSGYPCRPNSGAGGVIGAVAGGVIGHNVAGGPNRGVGTVLGAIAGGVVGNAVENSTRCEYRR